MDFLLTFSIIIYYNMTYIIACYQILAKCWVCLKISVIKIRKIWVHVGLGAARNMAGTGHNVLRYSLFYH
jgi:hypothetical protein